MIRENLDTYPSWTGNARNAGLPTLWKVDESEENSASAARPAERILLREMNVPKLRPKQKSWRPCYTRVEKPVLDSLRNCLTSLVPPLFDGSATWRCRSRNPRMFLVCQRSSSMKCGILSKKNSKALDLASILPYNESNPYLGSWSSWCGDVSKALRASCSSQSALFHRPLQGDEKSASSSSACHRQESHLSDWTK